jgi:hypothetical protein
VGDHSIVVTLEVNPGISRRAHVRAPDPSCWSEDDARAFAFAVWALLEARAAESFRAREVDRGARYRLEFVADQGAAISEPLALSLPALGWVQSVSFVEPGGCPPGRC